MRRPSEDQVFEGRPLPKGATMFDLGASHERRQLQVHQSRFRRLELDLDAIARRTLSAQLLVDGQLAGSFRFYEYQFAPLIGAEELLDCADAHSAVVFELAEVICIGWPEPHELTDRGNIVELSRAWMSPEYSRGDRFAQAATFLISLIDGWSSLLLKAFPLEHEGNTNDTSSTALTKRQGAMIRHYRKIFGVEQFPGDFGAAGWMFAINPRLQSFVPSPEG